MPTHSLQKGPTKMEMRVLGEVMVEGVSYRIDELHLDEYEVRCCSDGRRAGKMRGSPTLMWLLEAEAVEQELLHEILRTAIEEGVILDLPTD
jgi:hypothetical protein